MEGANWLWIESVEIERVREWHAYIEWGVDWKKATVQGGMKAPNPTTHNIVQRHSRDTKYNIAGIAGWKAMKSNYGSPRIKTSTTERRQHFTDPLIII